MKNKYCIRCGEPILERSTDCNNCGSKTIEMPLSDKQKEFIEKVQRHNEENPPSKIKGCLATLLILGFMFGLPAFFTFSGIGMDSIVGMSLTILVLLLINGLIFKYRKNMTYKQVRYYNLSEHTEDDFKDRPLSCRHCNQVVTLPMVYCPSCGIHTHEDLPVDRSLISAEKHCKSCGTIVSGKKFCPECGLKLEVN